MIDDTAYQRGRERLFNTWCWLNGHAVGKMQWDPISYPTERSSLDGLNTKMLRTKVYNFKIKYGRISF